MMRKCLLAAALLSVIFTGCGGGGGSTPINNPPASPAATPTFSPAAGTFTSVQSVALSDATGGASIYYTTDGTTPSASSTLYSKSIPVSSSQTIQAIAVASGYSNSTVASAAYTIDLPAAAAPTFTPTPGTYLSAQTVSISDTTADASLYYTIDGSTPTTSSTLYSSPITVSTTTTINAIAAAGGYSDSAVASGIYTIPVTAIPTFSPAPGTIIRRRRSQLATRRRAPLSFTRSMAPRPLPRRRSTLLRSTLRPQLRLKLSQSHPETCRAHSSPALTQYPTSPQCLWFSAPMIRRT